MHMSGMTPWGALGLMRLCSGGLTTTGAAGSWRRVGERAPILSWSPSGLPMMTRLMMGSEANTEMKKKKNHILTRRGWWSRECVARGLLERAQQLYAWLYPPTKPSPYTTTPRPCMASICRAPVHVRAIVDWRFGKLRPARGVVRCLLRYVSRTYKYRPPMDMDLAPLPRTAISGGALRCWAG
jgi:hypothetical protein